MQKDTTTIKLTDKNYNYNRYKFGNYIILKMISGFAVFHLMAQKFVQE